MINLDTSKFCTLKKTTMLSKKAHDRLLKNAELVEATLESTPLNGMVKDILKVCRALEIYRELSAWHQWWGTGDETPHAEYLAKSDEIAKKIYRRKYADKRNAGTPKQ